MNKRMSLKCLQLDKELIRGRERDCGPGNQLGACGVLGMTEGMREGQREERGKGNTEIYGCGDWLDSLMKGIEEKWRQVRRRGLVSSFIIIMPNRC